MRDVQEGAASKRQERPPTTDHFGIGFRKVLSVNIAGDLLIPYSILLLIVTVLYGKGAEIQNLIFVAVFPCSCLRLFDPVIS